MADDAFGTLGAWVPRDRPTADLIALAREVEQLGYGTLWLAGGMSPGVFDVVETVLAATERILVGTGIVNVWFETPAAVTAAWNRLEDAYPGRLYVGLGISHAPLVDNFSDQTYARPLDRMRDYLDELDALPSPLPPERRLLAALGPKMVRLAAERTRGSHPYLVLPANTAAVRAGIGAGTVAPELGVVLEPDLAKAREIGRDALDVYFGFPNYTNNWLRACLTEQDIATRSDRLIDQALALGDAEAIGRSVQAQRAAGADHVAIQVVGPEPHAPAAFRALAYLV